MVKTVRERKRAYVETYGCQMNISDGELMEGILAARGWELVGDPGDADVVLVNTCAIREHAERRVLGRVGQLNALKRERPGMVLGVTGCMAQRMGEDLLEKAPYVDLVMGPDGYRGLPDALQALDGAAEGDARGEGAIDDDTADAPAAEEPGSGAGAEGASAVAARGGWVESTRTARSAPPLVQIEDRRGRAETRPQVAALRMDPGENYEGLEQRRTSEVSAWVPIQRGCDHRCTYCIVPYVRGPEKNRTPEEVLAEIRRIAASGVSEVTLLGQTVNSYRHGDVAFPDLLRDVARIPGIRRVRFTSPHPNDVGPELVEVMATEPAVCEQLHLPLQSGSDEVLRRMVRRYDVGTFLEKVELVRDAIPDVALSTDVIVGFPGESEEDFRATLDVMREVRFDDAFTYRFSAREGTPATRMPEEWTVPEGEGQARLEELIRVARGVQADVNRSEVGRTEEVLIERKARDPGHVLGRTRRNKVVAVPGPHAWIGSYRTAHLEKTTGATFAGRVVRGNGARESA